MSKNLLFTQHLFFPQVPINDIHGYFHDSCFKNCSITFNVPSFICT
uniref:Uncharacterized protein n=1 Tax=Rhizophora mucronata TaxID=61149 RepID=A0A2P2PLW6_RHIMU